MGFDFFAGDAAADTEARFLEGGIYSSTACVVSFTLPSILDQIVGLGLSWAQFSEVSGGVWLHVYFFPEPQALALALTYQRETQHNYIYFTTTESPLGKEPYDRMKNLLRTIPVL